MFSLKTDNEQSYNSLYIIDNQLIRIFELGEKCKCLEILDMVFTYNI